MAVALLAGDEVVCYESLRLVLLLLLVVTALRGSNKTQYTFTYEDDESQYPIYSCREKLTDGNKLNVEKVPIAEINHSDETVCRI